MNEILRPGKYFFGDGARVLSNELYNGIYGGVHGYENGYFEINGNDFAIHSVGTQFSLDKPQEEFFDTKGRKYNIKSGMISLTNMELISNPQLCKGCGHIFQFNGPINFIYSGGTFIIKSAKKAIIIKTILDSENYDSENDEFCMDEDGNRIEHFLDASDSESIYEEDSDEENNSENLNLNNESANEEASEEAIEDDIQDNLLLKRKSFFKK